MVVYSKPKKGCMCASKEKLGLGHRHKDALPMKGPCTCRGAGEIQQGVTRGTAVEPPPACRKGLRKAQAHCPPGRIQVGLVHRQFWVQHSQPPPSILPASPEPSCFRVQSMVLASPGRPGPAWEDLH